MIRDELRKTAKTSLGSRVSDINREPGYLYAHGSRVAAIAEKLYRKVAGKKDPDYDDTMFAGALFHDIGKGYPEHHHAGAHMIPRLLESFAERIDLGRVAMIVGNHCLRDPAKPVSLEIAVVQDADMIDHFGAQGVWLGLQRTARTNTGQIESINRFAEREKENRADQCRALLNLDLSKKLFDTRADYERKFYQRLREEHGMFEEID